MATAMESKLAEVPAQQAAVKPRKAGSRPDLSTLLGIAIALGGIIGGLILEKGNIQDLTQGTAAMIVFGGTIGAVMVTTPMSIVLRAVRAARHVFFEHSADTAEMIERLILYATQARKQGIASLEEESYRIDDPFLRKALALSVDGTDLQ